MKLETIQDTMWAVHPAKLEEINAVVNRLLSGEKIDYQASSGKDDSASPYPLTQDGIAIVSVTGTLMKRANWISHWSGGTSTQLLKADIAKALVDSSVKGILLIVDSPGGIVHGTKDLADFIFENRGKKPIVAYTDGLMCSAAYWIASAAGEVVASKTSEVGSIGVALTHYDAYMAY
ncbi:MAG: S49 family peptidase [Deltaproteobacteria bacterium]|nr:MAG: S49 family peptidase [Deltaproteobacteria bacterium]